MASSYGAVERLSKPYRWLEFGMEPGWLNVGPIERWASAAAGLALAFSGLRRRGLPGVLLAFAGGALLARGATGHSPAYQWLGINRRPIRPETGWPAGTVLVEKSITIDRPAADLYTFWRKLENLPSIMTHLEAVSETDATHSHWVAKAPANMTVEWRAQITEDRPNEAIAWRSLEGSQVQHAGTVQFRPAPAGRGTEVHVRLQVLTPGGKAGHLMARMFGESPKQQISADLRRFKQLMETGEIATTDGQPSCRR